VPEILHDLTRTSWSWVLHACTAAAALVTLFALWTRRYRLARVGAIVQVTLIIWGWAFSQFPHLVKPDLTFQEAASPPVTLRLMLWSLAAGALLLFPSFFYLFRVFGKVPRGRAGSG
jgi:cytochrome d ubiquinol oxidase subunit II